MENILKIWNRAVGDPIYFGALVLRLAFGILFLLAAVAKLKMGIGGFAEVLVSADDMLAREVPVGLLRLYGRLVPLVEFSVGVFLILGVFVRWTYAAVAVLYLSFIFGQVFNGNVSIVGAEYFPTLVALVLAFYLYERVSVEESSKGKKR